MAVQDTIKVKHLNGTVEVTRTPAEGGEQSIKIPEGAQARHVARQISGAAGTESENETKFDAA